MKPHSLAIFAASVICALSASPAFAEADQLHETIEGKKNVLAISGNYSQFTLPAGEIAGSGVKFEFAHAFTERVSLEFFLSSTMADGVINGTSFTGFGSHLFYSFNASHSIVGESTRQISLDEQSVVKETLPARASWQVGIGGGQYFISGSRQTYSIAGPSLGVNSYFELFGWNWKAAGRWAQMTSGSQDVSGIFLSLGLALPL
jgi:hypothetical protein